MCIQEIQDPQKNERKEIWMSERGNPENELLKKALESFYFLFASEDSKKHITKLSDAERISIIDKFMGGESSFDYIGGELSESEEIELRRLFLERELLVHLSFIKPKYL